jgi:hypothetical protein
MLGEIKNVGENFLIVGDFYMNVGDLLGEKNNKKVIIKNKI